MKNITLAVIALCLCGSAAWSSSSKVTVSSLKMGTSHHTYIYIFEGKALVDGAPCPGAKIDLHITTPHTNAVQEVVAGPDGSYAFKTRLYGSPAEPVEWELDGSAPDAETVGVSGDYILLNSDAITTIEKPIDFTHI